eukprot:3831487-Pleurochrysis_carterae.AAC.1
MALGPARAPALAHARALAPALAHARALALALAPRLQLLNAHRRKKLYLHTLTPAFLAPALV